MLYQEENSVGKYFLEIKRYDDFYFEEHMHRHYELIYVHSGEVEVDLRSIRTTVGAGKCAFVPSNTLHSYSSPNGSIVDVCIFSGDFVPLFEKEMQKKQIKSCSFICEKNVLEFAKSVLFSGGELPSLYMTKSALYALMHEAMRELRFEQITDKKEILMERLVNYVAKNFRENISLATAAAELGYDKHYLSRCFHSSLEMHFSRYVNLFRVDYATSLLQHTEMPITQVALESGFQSIRTFNRAFLEITEKTPHEFFKDRA